MEVDTAREKQSPKISDGNGVINNSKKKSEKEGSYLLGSPAFKDLGNGRLKCVETGHDLPAKEKEAYGRSKACRLALIDAAVAGKKPPLNMFRQCPLSKSKLVCKLTGDTINKSEEHIWKHITGKRFQNKLEQKEAEKMSSPGQVEKKSKKLVKLSTDAHEDAQKIEDDVTKENRLDKNSDSEEPDFWMPPLGDRWDFDDGRDRWEDCMSSEREQCEEDDGLDEADEQNELESVELSMRTKRMSIAVGPSSFASRKKKFKKNSTE